MTYHRHPSCSRACHGEVQDKSLQVSGKSLQVRDLLETCLRPVLDLLETCLRLVLDLRASSREASWTVIGRPSLLFYIRGLAHEPTTEIFGIQIKVGADVLEGV